MYRLYPDQHILGFDQHSAPYCPGIPADLPHRGTTTWQTTGVRLFRYQPLSCSLVYLVLPKIRGTSRCSLSSDGET